MASSSRTYGLKHHDSESQANALLALFIPLVTEFGRHNQLTKTKIMVPSKKEILAASAGSAAVIHESDVWSWHWRHLSALLEGVLDTSALATTWFILGAVLGQGTKAAEGLQKQLIGVVGVVALATGTAVEAGLAVKKSRLQIYGTVLRS